MTTVRQYESGDEQQIRDIALQNYAEQLQEPRPIDFEDPAVDTYLQHIIQIQASGKGVVVVAEEGEKLVGFVCLLGPDSTAADKNSEDAYAFMSDLYVIPECRSKGIGSLLARSIEEQARAMGADYLALRVAADSTGPRSFYTKNQYREKFVVMSKELSDHAL